MAPGTTVNTVHISNVMRNEGPDGITSDTIMVDEGARVTHMAVCNATIISRAGSPIKFLSNHGEIGTLNLVNVYEK